jgi:integrase/recombinase XerD
VAKLRLGDFQDDGTQYMPRFQEKGGKSREIPVRHDLEGIILACVEAAGITGDGQESPLFRAGINGMTKRNTWLDMPICGRSGFRLQRVPDSSSTSEDFHA